MIRTFSLMILCQFLFFTVFAQEGSLVTDGGEDPQNIRVQQSAAQFPGGKDSMNVFIYETLEYPDEAVKERVTGNVGVTFTVDSEGKVTNIRVMQPVHPALDAEAIRIVESMPDWEPAKRNNMAVRSNPVIFISFRL